MTFDNEIIGWYHREFTAVLQRIDALQRQSGFKSGVCEIGVFHGASFVPLARLTRDGEPAVAIDVFSAWDNESGSGAGATLAAFGSTVDKHLRGVCVLVEITDSKRSVFLRTTRFRIVSIDGNHTEEATHDDLVNAERALDVGGVLIVDDVVNPSWPGVGAGLKRWLRERPDMVVIYQGWNKTVLTRRNSDIYSMTPWWVERGPEPK